MRSKKSECELSLVSVIKKRVDGMGKDLMIRSSSAEFLIFERQKEEGGVEVRFEEGDLWLTQKAIGELYNTTKQDISYHLKNIFDEMELDENSVVEKYLTTASDGKILETDVLITKNYLSKEEMEQLELIVTAFLDLAEARAKRNIPMTMEDWATRIDKFLLSDDRDILKDAGKISHEIACDKALTEFEKYRVRQDKLYKSDFDRLMEEAEGYVVG